MGARYSSEKIDLLTSLYEAERADNAAAFTNTLAILGFLIAYVAAVLGFVTTAASVNGLVLAFAPTPACGLIAYHQVMVGMNAARAASAQRLEGKIRELLDDDEHLTVRHSNGRGAERLVRPKQDKGDLTFGVFVGEQFLDPAHASWARTLGSGFPYLTLIFAALGFTVYILILASRQGAAAWAMVLGIAFAVVGLVAAGWNLVLNGRRPEVKSLGGTKWG